MNFIVFLTLLVLCAEIEKSHYNRRHKVANYKYRYLQRFLIILVSANNPIQFLALSLLWIGLFDGTLNHLRHLPTYHLGTNSPLDTFFRGFKMLYKIIRWSSLLLGFSIGLWEQFGL